MLFTTHAVLTIGEHLAKLSLLCIRDTKTLPVVIAKTISSPRPVLFGTRRLGSIRISDLSLESEGEVIYGF